MQTRVIATLTAMLLAAGTVQASITIQTVPVGNPGNAADTAAHSGNSAGQGSVSYSYNIGKYEVTAGQYTAFLNAVAATDTYFLYKPDMDTSVNSYGCNIKRSGSSGHYVYTVGTGTSQDVTNWANRPVNCVSYWDSCRFANWLTNGQPTGAQVAGTTERGAYTLDGYNGWDGRTIQRNVNAKWAVSSEDEWYKAAYYRGGGASAGYWDYPTKSNTAPSNAGSDGCTDPGNHANYYKGGYTIGGPYYRTNGGEFENSGSAYGTFDQGGNVFEWNEAVVYQYSNYVFRGLRGGSFYNDQYDDSLYASHRDYCSPYDSHYSTGFRVSQVPEPASMALLALGGIGMLLRRRFGIAHRERGLRR